ncbi:ABC transporter substrate-binding protein [Actinoplanes subtropicus]|uniref:ABC transporter substrate-binding protein n=1 Tax=Actinoplanes subtropicus TaxID=543632 RepID=UPI0012F9D0CC|nr:ABC transporter substrate-binding protein [Actinoplanes subtropicus]
MKFTGFVGGPGILTQTQDAIKVFNKENPQYQMTFVQGQLNQAPYQQLLTMYASGNVPTIFVVDAGDVAKVADKVVDLSGEKWAQEEYPWARQQGAVDGKVLAAPQSATGIGLAFNRKLVEAAIGGAFDPTTIKTRSDLAALFAKIKAAGTAPVIVSPLPWLLAGQFLTKMYDAQGDDSARARFIAQLKAGTADLARDKVFNGLMDTFDLTLKYNLNAARPIAGTIDTDAKAFADGKAAFWFIGDYQWPQLQALGASPDGDGYGIMPVPVSDDPTDPWNQKVVATSSFMMAIDKTVNTPAQQDAAKAYLDWYVHSASGQDFMVNKTGGVPAYRNVTLQPSNPIGRMVAADLQKDRTYTPISGLPADHWNVLGDQMIKYMAGKIDRAGLAKAITAYWKTQK